LKTCNVISWLFKPLLSSSTCTATASRVRRVVGAGAGAGAGAGDEDTAAGEQSESEEGDVNGSGEQVALTPEDVNTHLIHTMPGFRPGPSPVPTSVKWQRTVGLYRTVVQNGCTERLYRTVVQLLEHLVSNLEPI
jgi:hypothetical protein